MQNQSEFLDDEYHKFGQDSQVTDSYLKDDDQSDRYLPIGDIDQDKSSNRVTWRQRISIQNHGGALSCQMITPYLDDVQCENLPRYKYWGQDDGIIYRYFMGPLAQFLVNRTPEWIAPNVITCVGFMFCVIPFTILFGCYGTKFSEEEGNPIPTSFFIFQAFSYFMYRLLDEMDGKQARKTGNSSPLGLIFDHGCDAFGIGIQAMMFCKCGLIGEQVYVLIPVSIIGMIFHMFTLEEYYLGGLYLGVGNFVSDGLVFMMGIYFSMAYYGNEFWAQEFDQLHGMRLNDFICYVAIVSQVICIAYRIHYIIALSNQKDNGGRPEGEKLIKSDLAKQIFGYVAMIASTTYLAFIGNNPIYKMIIPDGSPSPLFFIMVLQCFIMQHLTCSLQVCHVTKKKYSPFNNKLLMTVFLAIIVIMSIDKLHDGNISSPTCVYTLLAIVVVCQWHFIITVIQEMAEILNINIFRVKPKQQQQSLL